MEQKTTVSDSEIFFCRLVRTYLRLQIHDYLGKYVSFAFNVAEIINF